MNPSNNLFEIRVGDLELLAQGSVISPDADPVSITIDDLTVDFEFIFDSSETHVESNVVSDKKLKLSLYNHSGLVVGGATPPVGAKDPISIGTVFGRELLLMYRLTTKFDDNEPKTVTLLYNFYLGEKTTTTELED